MTPGLFCQNCQSPYETLLFHCPSCGVALVHCSVEGDTVIFSSTNGWKEVRAIAIKGRPVGEISTARMTPKGFDVTSKDGNTAQISLLQLYHALTSPDDQVIEL